MGQSIFVATEQSATLPILIIDREGSIGIALYAALKEHTQVVLVGGREPATSENLLYLAFNKAIPEIPEDAYSHILFLPESESDMHDILPACKQKAIQDRSKLLVVVRQDLVTESILRTLHSLEKGMIPIIVGDVFGNPYGFFPGSEIEKLFYAAKVEKSLKLHNMGLSTLYPIAFDDVIVELLRLAFGSTHHTTILYCSMPYGVTTMNVAHALQKVDPVIRIDFTQQTETGEHFPGHGTYTLSSQYPIFDKLQHAYKTYQIPTQKFSQVEKKKEEQFFPHDIERKKKPSKRTNVVFMIATYILLLVLLPVLSTFGATGIGVLSLYQAERLVISGNISAIKQPIIFADHAFAIAQVTEKVLLGEVRIFNAESMLYPLTDMISTGKIMSENLLILFTASEKIQQVLEGDSQYPQENFSRALQDIQSATLSLEKISTHPNIPQKEKNFLQQKITLVSPFLNLIDGIPSLVGMDKPKTYLVLFQNNMELRPSGGFIGSFGLVTVSKGKVVNFHIQDVYDADGQLKGHIEPPFPIRRYIPMVHLYLRDSNFDVDFTKNAYIAALLLQQETGQTVDGVVAVDLSFVKSILAGVGNIYIPTYNETVTPDNLFTLTENHAEKNFFPGSTQKKDFLRSLYEALQTKLRTDTHIPYGALGESVLTAIKEKHVLFAVSDSSVQDLFTLNGFSSSLWDPRSPKANTIDDFIGINEANIGVNKVNYYISRSLKHAVMIGDTGSISGTLAITYRNTSDGTWPGGVYKNYLRVLLPQNAHVEQIHINGQDQQMVPAVTDFLKYEAKNFSAPIGLEVDHTEESGKNVYGFFVQIDQKSEKTITISYTLSTNVDTTQPVLNYNLFTFKQPGTEMYPYAFSLTFPSSYAVLKSTPKLAEDSSGVSYVSQAKTDEHLDIVLRKK